MGLVVVLRCPVSRDSTRERSEEGAGERRAARVLKYRHRVFIDTGTPSKPRPLGVGSRRRPRRDRDPAALFALGVVYLMWVLAPWR